ncbi:MAG: efflux RND transporter permease subunit [Firmicutes bacterium]|nr:efflux RND transporter permease subunit [Bacillota bacterium]
MTLSQLAIRRPVTIAMIVVFVLLFGFLSLNRLGLDLLPKLNVPFITVATVYPNTDALTVEEEVTKPIEAALGTIDGLKKLESYSVENISIVVAQFHWTTPVSQALERVRANLDQLVTVLPQAAQEPLVLTFDPAQLPLMVVSVSGPEDLLELTARVKETVIPRLERVPGVAQASILGGRDKEIHINYDNEKLRAHNISPTLLEQFLTYQNMVVPGGVMSVDDTRYYIKTGMRFQSADELREMIIGQNLEAPENNVFGLGALVPQFIRLGDVADVVETSSREGGINRTDGKPALVVRLFKQAGENTVAVADRVKGALAELEAGSGSDLDYFILNDQSQFIRQSIVNLEHNGLLGAALAILVLFLFLRNLQTITIIGFAIPLSVVLTFVFMYFGKLTLNLMTLGGLALGVGMLVDNSIVVLENIYRLYREGKDPEAASLEGSNQVAAAITASTLTTLAVFVPLAYVGGLAGELFKELGLTVSFSLLASLLVALTVVPVLTTRLLSRREGLAHEAIRASFTDRLQGWYTGLLQGLLRRRGQALIITAGLLLVSLALVPRLGIEFLPPMDQSILSMEVRLPAGTPADRTDEVVGEIEEILWAMPEVKHINAQIGNPATRDFLALLQASDTNMAQLLVNLTEPSQRDRTAAQLAQEIREKTSHVPARITVNEDLTIGAFTGFLGGGIALQIRGNDLDTLAELSNQLVAKLEASDTFLQVRSSLQEEQPELFLQTNPARALQSQLTSGQIGLAVRNILGGVQVGTISKDGRSIPIILQPKEALDMGLDDLLRFRISSPTSIQGPFIQLGRLVQANKTTSPASIRRLNRLRVVEVTAQLRENDVMAASKELDKILADLPLPPDYEIVRGGIEELIGESQGDLLFVLLLALVLVYLVMASQFESLVHPLLIMVSVPLAAIGSFWALWLTRTSLGLTSMMGLIMLAGIVVNNAIVLVDYINLLRREGVPPEEAVLRAGTVRLRPILMTAITTVLGLLPLALGFGEGTEIQAPLAITVIGGLVTSTVLTLFIIPVIYVSVTKKSTPTKELTGLSS